MDNHKEDMRKFFTIITILVTLIFIISCVRCYQIKIPEDNLSFDFANDPVEIVTGNYTITITPYYKPIQDSDANEAGEMLTGEDVKRGTAWIN